MKKIFEKHKNKHVFIMINAYENSRIAVHYKAVNRGSVKQFEGMTPQQAGYIVIGSLELEIEDEDRTEVKNALKWIQNQLIEFVQLKLF